MAALEKVGANICAMQLIANVDSALSEALNLPQSMKSLGIFTADSDDVAYIAADEATKHADVEVVYGRSMYAGANNSPSFTSGEVVVMFAGKGPSDVRTALTRVVAAVGHEVSFQWADERRNVAFLAHVVTSCGSYLSSVAGVCKGESIAYLIAPALEATVGLDAALKASDVRLLSYIEPPSPTNYGGAYLHGSQSACKAAANAFSDAVIRISKNPVSL